MKKVERPKGYVRMWARKPGCRFWTLIDEGPNLFVNAGLPALASLLGGVTSGEYGIATGFGSSGTPETVNDTSLTGPSYYNAIVSASEDGAGSVTFSWGIQASDYGAVGLTVAELGLFANTGSVTLPIVAGSNAAIWTASTAEVAGNLIQDSNGNIQQVATVTGDALTGGSAPTWATALNTTTTDNHVTWTLVCLAGTAPTPMLARRTITPVNIPSGFQLGGTWQFTF
jgi:hypothetical protein